MAAEQAAEVAEVPVAVIPTKTISQGLTAMLGYNPEGTLEENKEAMTEQAQEVVSGQITTAVRDTSIDGVEIKKDDFLGMVDGKIVLSEEGLVQAALDTLEKMIQPETEIITIIFGEETTEKVAEEVKDKLQAVHEDLEIEIHEGNQPVYPFLFSAE